MINFKSLSMNIIIFGLILALLDPLLLCNSARTRLRNTLDVKFNLDCNIAECNSSNNNHSAVNLFQVTSTNPESPEKINYIWSNIGGPPMIITTSSTQDSKLMIDWEALLRGKKRNDTSGLYFNASQDATIGLLFEKLVIFDTEDEHKVENTTLNWSDIIWDLASASTFHKDDFLRTSLKMRPNKTILDGSMQIKLAIPRDFRADRQKETPHLKMNGQSISIAIVIDQMKAHTKSNNHLLLSFIIAVQTPTGLERKVNTESLISDQYLPGVFSIKSLQFVSTSGQNSSGGDQLGFFHWKEVAYTDKRKPISHTTEVRDTENPLNMSDLPIISSPFSEFFRQRPSKGEYKFYRFELEIGDQETYYSSSNFTDFSFVFGLGAVPQEQMFSFLAKVMIFVCFCLPNVVMLAGLSYLMLKRFSKNSDTELLLAAENN